MKLSKTVIIYDDLFCFFLQEKGQESEQSLFHAVKLKNICINKEKTSIKKTNCNIIILHLMKVQCKFKIRHCD